MRSRFLTENRWLLKLCAGVARFCGLLALFGTGVLLAVTVIVAMQERADLSTMAWRDLALVKAPPILFYGCLSLILAEFLSYLLAEQGEPKWLLRHGDKVICAYILYFLYLTVAPAIALAQQTASAGSLSGIDLHNILYSAFLVLSGVMQSLIWIGIAVVLRKVVPIIRESKTLV